MQPWNCPRCTTQPTADDGRGQQHHHMINSTLRRRRQMAATPPRYDQRHAAFQPGRPTRLRLDTAIHGTDTERRRGSRVERSVIGTYQKKCLPRNAVHCDGGGKLDAKWCSSGVHRWPSREGRPRRCRRRRRGRSPSSSPSSKGTCDDHGEMRAARLGAKTWPERLWRCLAGPRGRWPAVRPSVT